nr:hypothetical protein [Bacteroidales bacterium]
YDKTDQMNVSYETICAALAPKCGLSETKTMWQGNIVFRVVMMPGSIVADGIASNYITVPATISYADPSTSIFLQTDAAGDYFVWAWNGDNGGEAYTEAGAWPGDKMTLLESGNNSYLYKYEFKVMPQNTPPANIIISTDNGSVKLFDGVAFENHKTFEYSKPAEVDPSEKQGYKLYIEDLSGWEQIALYTYGQSEILGGWPGKTEYNTETVAGIEFKVFEIEGAGESQTFIINNNGNGEQIDGPQVVLNQNYYFTVSDGTFKPTEFSFRFKAETEGSYYVWAWGGDFGGESFTESGVWPGDALTLVGEEEDGFVYEYHFIKTPGIPPSNIIISTDNGDTKFYDGVEFVNGKQY